MTGNQLRDLRMFLGLSQKVFAFRIGLSQGLVSKLERKRKTPLTPEHRFAVVSAVNQSADVTRLEADVKWLKSVVAKLEAFELQRQSTREEGAWRDPITFAEDEDAHEG